MTMKAIKTKAKGKKNSTKFGRVKLNTKETSNVLNPDFSSLRKPVDISASSLCQVIKLLESGSDEVKAILAYECDIVYECRICRSLFRSLVNFISHKRVYCKDKYNISLNKNILQDCNIQFTKDSFVWSNDSDDILCKDNYKNDRILRSQVPREKNKKDLTAIIDMLHRKQTDDVEDQMSELIERIDNVTHNYDNEQMSIEVMDSINSMTYQNKNKLLGPYIGINEEEIELEQMLHQDLVISNVNDALTNVRTEKSDSPVQVYGSDDENDLSFDGLSSKPLICSICNAKFSTKKTLTVHTRTLHTPHRMCYPCPCCTSTFASTWSVYRHLFKVHRKSNDQVRKLRTQIQEKAFRKEMSGSDELHKDICNTEEYVDNSQANETQEWINHLESDVEIQMCGGCGRRFDRKVALSAHLQQCQKRIALYSTVTSKIKKPPKINKESVTATLVTLPKKPTDVTCDESTESSSTVNFFHQNPSDSLIFSNVTESCDTPIRVEAVGSLSKDDWDRINNEKSAGFNENRDIDVFTILSKTQASNNVESNASDTRLEPSPTSDLSDAPEIIYTRIDKPGAMNPGSKKRKVAHNNDNAQTVNNIGDNNNTNVTAKKNSDSTDNLRSGDLSNSVDYTRIMENKIATIANLRKLQCLPCKRKFTSMTNLRRHMAIHVGWNRYRCKLCTFKCFVKCDCVAHCNKVHNTDNDRMLIAKMVLEIPQDQYACNQDIVMDISTIEKNINELESLKALESSTDENTNLSTVVSINEHVKVDKEVSVKDAFNFNDTNHVNCAENTNKINEDRVSVETNGTNLHSRRLDVDPDLRRMVMEVIFGSSESNGSEEMNSKQSDSLNNIALEEKSHNNNKRKANENGDHKGQNSPSSKDDIRPQRPIRNRVKPVRQDFIYDLKDVAFRKEPTAKGSIVEKTKTLTSRKSVSRRQSQGNLEIQPEDCSKSPVRELDNDDPINKCEDCSKSPIRALDNDDPINNSDDR